MVSDIFESAFRRLVGAFKRYHDVPRRPDNVPELGQARIVLDDARSDMRSIRRSDARQAAVGPVLKADVSDGALDLLRIRAISDTARSG